MNTKILLLSMILMKNKGSSSPFHFENNTKPSITRKNIKKNYNADDGTVLLISNITYPIISYNTNANVEDAINTYFNNKVKEMKEYEKDSYLSAKNFYESYPDSSLLPYTIEVNFTTELNTNRLLSFKLLSNSFLGGAHSNPTTKGVTFDLENGNVLGYEDIYISNKRKVNETLNSLIEGYIEDNNLSSSLFPYEKGKLPLPYENSFYLTKDSIVYIYNPYEIAPYATGIIYIPIEYVALDEILSNKFKSYFVKNQ